MSAGTAAEIKSKLGVADVVGETVTLRKAGTTLKGLCPFHSEKTPSFVVTPARESWHCFGCGEGGDIFSFVMKRDGLTFPEALRLLAGKAGVEVDEQTRREDSRKGRLRDVLEMAVAFYHSVLTSHRLGQPALDYLRARGFRDDTITRFQLGWAPGGWDTLVRQLGARRQVLPADLAEAGLTSPGRRGPIDKFRERIIFPIRDASGHAVGLGGRILPSAGAEDDRADRGPKYLNSPATQLFDKSRTLYLIDRAKGPIRKAGQAVIVEGYTDALIAHQAGFDNVVASLGTALTPGQVALLTRYARRIALAYDVDPAGERAGTLGVTALEALIRQLADANAGVELDEVRVVRLPDGRDPDEVVLASPDQWRTAVTEAAPIVDYLIDYQARQTDLRTPGGRARFADALLPTLGAIPNPVMRDAYLQRVRQVSGIEERTLLEALHRPRAASSANRITADAVRAAPDALPVGDILRAITPVEAELLRLALLVPGEQERLAEELAPERLPSQLARELFAALVASRAPDERGIRPPFARDALLAGLHPEASLLAQALYARPGPDPNALPSSRLTYEVDTLLLKLEYDDLEARDQYLDGELAEAERAGDRDAVLRLGDRQRQLHEQRRSLDRRRDQTRLLARPVAGRV